MAAQTLAGMDALLKEWYVDYHVDQLLTKATCTKLLRRKLVEFAGDYMVVFLRTGRNWGIGAVPTSSSGSLQTLRTPGYQTSARTLIDGYIMNAPIQVAQDVIDKSAKDPGAAYEALDFEMRGVTDDAADYHEHVLYGEGSGRLATVLAAPSGTTITVNNHYPFFVGQRIECWSGETGADTSTFSSASTDAGVTGATGNVQVVREVARNFDGSGVLTVDASGGATAGRILARAKARNASTGYEWMGLGGCIKATNPVLKSSFQNISRATTGNGYWKANVFDFSSVPPGEDELQQAFDHTADNGRGNVDVLLMHKITRRALMKNMFTTKTRFAASNVIQPGYLSGKDEDRYPDGADWLSFDGKTPMIVSRYADIDCDSVATDYFGDVLGLNLDSLMVALVTDWTWWAPDGRILSRSDSRQFGVMADLYCYGTVACEAPNRNFRATFDIESAI